MKARFKITPAVYLLLQKDNKLLLARRINTNFMDGYYSIPAGHLEGDETLTEAMIRETKEEIGIDLSKDQLVFVHAMNRKSTDGERIDFFFKAQNCQDEPKIMEPHKCDAMDWYDLDNLPENIIPYVKKVITMVGKDINYSENDWNIPY